jgi:hypothetical protein
VVEAVEAAAAPVEAGAEEVAAEAGEPEVAAVVEEVEAEEALEAEEAAAGEESRAAELDLLPAGQARRQAPRRDRRSL